MPGDSEIVVVSGLPRSGTSLMMQMLHRGGMSTLTDGNRGADADNPRGYFEFEPVKKTRDDSSWIPQARGKAVKVVSSLLYDLPRTETYRVLFMNRDIDEVLASQEKMLERLGRIAPPAEQMKDSFGKHLNRLFEWLPAQGHIQVMHVNYNSLVADPVANCDAISAFLDRPLDVEQMLAVIDSSLYRNRSGA